MTTTLPESVVHKLAKEATNKGVPISEIIRERLLAS